LDPETRRLTSPQALEHAHERIRQDRGSARNAKLRKDLPTATWLTLGREVAGEAGAPSLTPGIDGRAHLDLRSQSSPAACSGCRPVEDARGQVPEQDLNGR
jgi:hypothetical protein